MPRDQRRVNRVQIGGEVIEGSPKSANGVRRVWLSDAGVEALKAWRRTVATERLAFGVGYGDGPEVLVDEAGRPLPPEALSESLRRGIKAAKVRPVRFHDLRHASATFVLLWGESPLAVSRRLGHATAGFTLSVYGHVLDEQHAADAKRRGQG